MLVYDSLIEQAKSREMPPTKIRGILREYLQILILKQIYGTASGKKLFFTGGTYLRLVHDLKRFSEDLDFNTDVLEKKEFENLLRQIVIELKRTDIRAQVTFDHWKNIFNAKLVFPDMERNYDVVSKYSKKEGIMIKVETNKPKWKIRTETQVISGFGEFYPCVCTDKSALFADKIDAFTKKTRARHLYDIVFMLSNKYPIDREILHMFGIKKDPCEVIRERVKSFSGADLKTQAESIRPFLFNEKEADLIINAREIIPLLLEKYKK
ncbi:MAG: nucleotidyl transferase AbiEii/AbiGii toxin family protein [Candidatus Omnitrophota bacterium]